LATSQIDACLKKKKFGLHHTQEGIGRQPAGQVEGEE
jgi:hypothetical protein